MRLYLDGAEFEVHPNDVERLKKQGFTEKPAAKKNKEKVKANGN